MTPRARHYTTRAASLLGVDPAIVWTQRMGDARLARQLVWDTLRADGFSYPQIGMFTGRHHTTVMYGLGLLSKASK